MKEKKKNPSDEITMRTLVKKKKKNQKKLHTIDPLIGLHHTLRILLDNVKH